MSSLTKSFSTLPFVLLGSMSDDRRWVKLEVKPEFCLFFMEERLQRSATLSGSGGNSIDPGTDDSSGSTCRIPGTSEMRTKQNNSSSSTQGNIEHLRSITWNIESLTGKSKELAEVMKRRNIDVACLQETKWKNTDENKINVDFWM